jgi:type VI secretion system protein ImpB
MNKGSVSPKERVNIVYRSEIGDAKEDVELPLKVLTIGDFGFKEISTPLEDRDIVDIDNNNFDEIMARHNLSLDIEVPDRISGKPDSSLRVHLDFKGIKDFNPDNIINQVEALQKVIELRKAIMSLKGPLGNIPAFRRKVQELLTDEQKRKELKKELNIS